MNLSVVKAWLFPYRTHLELEVEYLRAQVAQKQRRVDEFQEMFAKISLRAVQPRERGAAPVAPEVKPKGWDEYRARRRGGGEEEVVAVE